MPKLWMLNPQAAEAKHLLAVARRDGRGDEGRRGGGQEIEHHEAEGEQRGVDAQRALCRHHGDCISTHAQSQDQQHDGYVTVPDCASGDTILGACFPSAAGLPRLMLTDCTQRRQFWSQPSCDHVVFDPGPGLQTRRGCASGFPGRVSHQRLGPKPPDEGGVDDAQQRVGGQRQHRGPRQVPHRPVVAIGWSDADSLECPPVKWAKMRIEDKGQEAGWNIQDLLRARRAEFELSIAHGFTPHGTTRL